MKKLNINYKPRYLILGLLIFVACVFFIRCYYHEPSGDEILYQYLWEDDDPTLLWDVNHKFIRKAHNLKDIIHFQVRHYKEINGRSFVHTIEQLFTDNFLLFSIVNTGVFVLFTFLCKRFVTDGGKGSYLLWLSIVCSLLFLFPYEKSLWTSINYGPNYLWPATAAVGVLILWNILDTRTISFKFIPLVTMLAIASGWSHEAFAVGLSGGMFLYYCSHLRKFKGQVLWLVLPYWISTTFMVFAPGNLIRFSGSTSVGSVSLLPKIFNGLDNVTQLTTFWLFWLGVVVIILFRRNTAITFAKNNVKLLCVLITSMVFSIIINMMPYSHTFCVLVALLVMIKYL